MMRAHARAARTPPRARVFEEFLPTHQARRVACGLRPPDAMDRDRFRASPAVRASVSPDGLVLLDVKGGLVLASNSTGARIWQLIEQRCTRAEIVRQLVADYEIQFDCAERDVAAFVAALAARGLVTAEPPC